MSRKEEAPRFGPGHWVTLRDTGEHVRVELWSGIAAAYRVRSRKGGLQFVDAANLTEISAHPQAELGKQWALCRAPGCGAPLTPDLATCPRCDTPMCSCGRCGCARVAAAPRKTTRKKPLASRR